MRFEPEPDIEEQVLHLTDELLRDRLAPKMVDSAKQKAPVDTGELRDSIGSEMDGHTLIIFALATYAAYVELGTRPHPIDAHGDYSLRSSSGQYFGRHVNHPGTKPEPYLRPAVYANWGLLLGLLGG